MRPRHLITTMFVEHVSYMNILSKNNTAGWLVCNRKLALCWINMVLSMVCF